MSEALKLHRRLRGKIEIRPKARINRRNLSLLYTPGVTEVTKVIAQNPALALEYTGQGNNLAIITDGSRTLGVGDSNPEASLPVMEGKALFLKALAGVDAYPLCFKTKDKDEIVRTVEILSPVFSAFNLEDIRAPKSLEIREELEKKELVVFHDDEQGVAIVVLAALWNALKVVSKRLDKVKIVLGGAGAAGYGVFNLLHFAGVKNLVVFNRQGIIYRDRSGNDNRYLREIAQKTNPRHLRGGKEEALKGADVFIGLTGVPNLLNRNDVGLMAKNPIIFALSNPNPEILPAEIKKATREFIFASGRSDFENQINNLIVFPGVLRGLLDFRRKMDLALELKIARALVRLVKKPRPKYIIPNPFDQRLIRTIVNCVRDEGKKLSGRSR